MPGPVLTATTPADLLKQCVSAQIGQPPLLARQFHSVAGVSNGDSSSAIQSPGHVRVMTWNTLADG